MGSRDSREAGAFQEGMEEEGIRESLGLDPTEPQWVLFHT